jgi:hypothetical protein
VGGAVFARGWGAVGGGWGLGLSNTRWASACWKEVIRHWLRRISLDIPCTHIQALQQQTPPQLSMADTMMSLLIARARETSHNTSDCTSATCPDSDALYNYRPSLVANSIFLALFSFALACYSVQGLWHRHAWGFSIAMVCGCIRESCDIPRMARQVKGHWGLTGHLFC